MSYLIDTNVISELVKKTPDRQVMQWFQSVPNDKLYISALTIGEIRKGWIKCQMALKKKNSESG